MDERKELIEAIIGKLYQIQDVKFLNAVFQFVKVFADKSQNKKRKGEI